MFKSIINYIGTNEKRVSITSSILAIISGLLFGLIIMLFTSPGAALPAFGTIITAGFENLHSLGQVLLFATPLIFTGLSVGFAFKTGLFNIGASGQYMIGAVVAVIVGVKWTFLPGFTHWLVALILAGIAGALWAALPGLLKAYRNVHEVVSTIMMNYIGLYLATYLVSKVVWDYNKGQSLSVQKSAVLPNLGLNKIFGDNSVNSGFIFAILAAIIIYIILKRTTFGYELQAVGYNKDASKYAGINEKKGIVMSMLIAGALSGLGGGVVYLFSSAGQHLTPAYTLAPEGFNGIPVALIGLSNPIGILFAGLFMGYITQSGLSMQIFEFSPQIINIIVSAIIYFSALVILFKDIIIRLYKRSRKTVVKRGENNE